MNPDAVDPIPTDTPADLEVAPDVPTDVVEFDVTALLSDDEIDTLFSAFDDEDWAEVDALINGVEAKAGGADRNSGGAEKLRRYWTVGAGGAKIRWGTDGDWTRCVEQLSKHLGPRAKGYCALRHKEQNGYYPGDKQNIKAASPSDMGSASLYHGSKHDDTPDLGASMFEHKTVGVKGLNVVDAAQGIVETVISVTGVVDNVKDRIKPGAYTKTLATRTPKGVWSHDWNEPVSKTLAVKELMPGDPELPATMPSGEPWPKAAGALKVKTQFNLDTQRGREAFSDVVFFGSEQEWSIGYQVPVGGAKVDPQSGVRDIDFLELYEYSPVLFGAMPLARTTSVKDAQMAFKALMEGGAASWVAEAAAKSDEAPVEAVDEAVVEEAVVEYGDDEDDDAMEGKGELSGDQMILVKSAIQTLSDLLEAVQAEYKVADDMDEPDDMEDEDVEDGEDDDYGSLVEAVDDIAGELDAHEALSAAAGDIDAAIANDDSTGLETASTAFLDAIEEAMGGEDDEALQELAQILGDMIEQISAMTPEPTEQQEDMPSEETVDKKMAMCPDCGKPMDECECDDKEGGAPMATEGKSLIDTSAVQSLLSSLDS